MPAGVRENYRGEALDILLFSSYTIFMNTTDLERLQEGWAIFTGIFMKYDILEKAPIDLGTGDKLNAAQIHMLESIGKGYGRTVTSLSDHFMITKGAVSQIVSKLHKLGYITKTKRKGNDKEIILELTSKGQMAFGLHEKYNEGTLEDLMRLREKYSQEELQAFLNILKDIDGMLMKFVTVEKKR